MADFLLVFFFLFFFLVYIWDLLSSILVFYISYKEIKGKERS